MKVLLIHNYYQQSGGEDQVFAAEAEVLRANGDEVRQYTQHNNRIASMGKLRLATSTFWNTDVFRELSMLLQEYTPDVIHCHNTFPLISPAAYEAARRLAVPVVQTLHNFRLLCLNGLFLRNGSRCEDCLGRSFAWPGVLHGCYRDSREASAVAATMLAVHRARGTWQTGVDTYIAMTEFARAKFVTGGLPADRIVVKPNFLNQDPGIGSHRGGFALYVGRLSAEKGIAALVQLWERSAIGIPLRIIGTGPLDYLARNAPPNIEWLGWQPRERVLEAMKSAQFLVFPTECYEGFPIVLLEAMATGLPVLASNRGSLTELIEHELSGILVSPEGPESWERAIRSAISRPDALARMGERARQLFEGKYTGKAGYELLSSVYRRTIEASSMGHALR
jgi:glycosyltransferase involved in cell wall biosynthesis